VLASRKGILMAGTVSAVLKLHQRPVDAARTPDNPCLYEAAAKIGGRVYAVRSRRGALFALARVLVAAGFPDQPVLVAHEGLRGEVAYRSLHWMATRTIEESATKSVRAARYREYPGREGVEAGGVVAGGGWRGGGEEAFRGESSDGEGLTGPGGPKIASQTRRCDGCGNEFRATRRASRFCSARCRLRAWRDREDAA
jgi:hypothetical protein